MAPNGSIESKAAEFLAQRRIAVAGVSRSGDSAANFVYKRLTEAGYEVFAVNPRAEEVDGAPCYSSVGAIPGGVGAVVVATPPSAAADVMRDSVEAGVEHVWIHRSFGKGSHSEEAVRIGEEAGVSVIPGACPAMYCEPVDFGHKCIRWWLGVRGKLP